ncbi:MAG: SGNH/GDSL hydrolase family protein [Clostridiaceae bacterium]|nr:SGNH/GDSL hydrolase family protein [Clostridiaceae bacterium]
MKISDIDENFRLVTTLSEEQIQWHSRFDGPFRIHGACIPYAEAPFCRMDPAILGQMSDGVRQLAVHTAGIRLRFQTDSSFFTLKAVLTSPDDMSHMPRTGSSGFDLYCGGGRNPVYQKTFMPGAASDVVVGEFFFAKPGLKDLTLNFPLYNGVKQLAIGLQPGCVLNGAAPYRNEQPAVFYGSSITQGGCASRPGNAYQSILSRMLDLDIINLGFSGSAKGEPEMARMIASLDMNLFVMDYDHNAPNAAYLQKTHEPFFQILREAHPDMPVIFISKPDADPTDEDCVARQEVILNTYHRARQAGDKQVFFIDGERLFGSLMRDSCTVDGCHPNDLGFMRMAEALYPTLEMLMR